jgi:hypothetical protein
VGREVVNDPKNRTLANLEDCDPAQPLSNPKNLYQIQKIARALAMLFVENVCGFWLQVCKPLSMEIIMQSFSSRVVLAGAALLAASAAFPSVGQADTFTLTSCHIGSPGSCGTATSFGTVTLTTNGTGVDFNVTLTGGNTFVETGSGGDSLFLFNDALTGSTVTNAFGTVNGVTNTQLSVQGATNLSPLVMANGTGDWSARVFCTTLSDCNGGSPQPGGNITDLHFTVTNATLAQLEVLNDKQNLFVADILCGATSGCTGTGPVDAVPGPVLGAGVPGLVLACAGLLGLARRRRKLA